MQEIGETEFIRRFQAPVRSLAAFDKSEHADDWRELMRLYLVRRTRSFIQNNYAVTDPENGRKYLTFDDGTRSYFPVRIPRTVRFDIDEQYSKLFADDVVDTINGLELPRYGLGNFVIPNHLNYPPPVPPTPDEAKVLEDLSRAGKRLMGFCRTNLFKRLESSGHAFLLSVERHVLRNFIYIHAIENEKALPIGTTDAGLLDSHSYDEDSESAIGDIFDDGDKSGDGEAVATALLRTEDDFRRRAAEVYGLYADQYKRRFRWLGSHHFVKDLEKDLKADSAALLKLLDRFGSWDISRDAKLGALHQVLAKEHPNEKILVFTQFADTVRYLEDQLKTRGVKRMSAVTGDSADPTRLAWRFSPGSNEKRGHVSPEEELRVLVSTDVLSEGQNLQDCAIVINYDLPWAIIRLIQRAGRVDRIGQQAQDILCYSFLPADGIERLIRLRARVRTRLHQNAEVVGTDEAFFEDEGKQAILDLYNERTGILDGDDETEVDLSSYAYQIWKNATTADPSLKKKIEDMSSVVYSSKPYEQKPDRPDGVLVYMRTTQGYDALVWMDRSGASVTESQFEILRAARCQQDTPALPRHKTHHELVRKAAELISHEEKQIGGQLGRPSGARFRTYERLKNYSERVKDTLFDTRPLRRAINDIYRYPLLPTAVTTLNRQLRSGISDEALAKLATELRNEERLCVIHEEDESREPQIICSLGLLGREEG